MHNFVSTDDQGNFTLDGEPWFLHAATYFGRRPGTCGADWMGEHFEHNLRFLDRDIATMQALGINTMGLFIPSDRFFDGVTPVQERFDQLDLFLEKIRAGGIRAIIFDLRMIWKDAWCEAHDIDLGDDWWHTSLHPEAQRAMIETKRMLHTPFKDRPEIVGWVVQTGRFFRYGFGVPPLRDAWVTWLRRRFDWDFGAVRDHLDLAPDEITWDRVRMPTEMTPYFNAANPRSYEFALMQQSLITQATNRVIEAVRPFTPDQMILTSMEGCCFSSGQLTSLIPEQIAADALWIEYYHWEGLRSYHLVKEEDRRWMPEPVADKPSVEILNAAGYVQMLTQWMKRSGKALIMCHGVDIGDQRRGVRSEEDQKRMLDRYNAVYHAAGGHGIAYWCWSDDELSKTYTRQFGYEFGSDTDASKKAYQQAGETMGIVRYDGSPRPVAEKIRARSEAMAGKPARPSPGETLVLLPSPVFQSLYRYRANLTAFGVFTSLGRQGIVAEAMMTSAGGRTITLEDLRPYRWVILGVSAYERDHPAIPELLLRYVQAGGTLFLPLARGDALTDAYLRTQASPALATLAGCATWERRACARLEAIRGAHPAFGEGLPDTWSLTMDETAHVTTVTPKPGAEVLATAAPGDGGDKDTPLLYRHPVGQGTVYVYTWNLDVFLYKGDVLDHADDAWDWLWCGIAAETGIPRDLDTPMRAAILAMAAEGDKTRGQP